MLSACGADLRYPPQIPIRSTGTSSPLLEKLDAVGVGLAGFELGNDIDSAMFNADFSVPAENPARSKEFTLEALSNNPEAR